MLPTEVYLSENHNHSKFKKKRPMKRKFPRKEFLGKGFLVREGEELPVHMTDISCTGISVIERDFTNISHLEIGDELRFQNATKTPDIEFEVTVEWKTEAGVGLSICEIDESNFKIWLRLLNKVFNQ